MPAAGILFPEALALRCAALQGHHGTWGQKPPRLRRCGAAPPQRRHPAAAPRTRVRSRLESGEGRIFAGTSCAADIQPVSGCRASSPVPRLDVIPESGSGASPRVPCRKVGCLSRLNWAGTGFPLVATELTSVRKPEQPGLCGARR